MEDKLTNQQTDIVPDVMLLANLEIQFFNSVY